LGRFRITILNIAILAMMILAPAVLDNLYYVGAITTIMINMLLAISLWFIMQTGQVSLGHAGFAAIGGYMSAALITHYGFGSWPGLVSALVISGLVALILGYITLRITGVYFVITTLALGEVTRIVFGMWDHPFGGLLGLMNLPYPDPISLFGLYEIKFDSPVGLYYLTLFFAVVCILLLHRLDKSSIGLVSRGISQADILAEHLGINIMNYKVLAFVIGSMVAGLAGVLYSYNTKCMQPTAFTMAQSSYCIVWVAVGGSLSILGPILGALVLGILSEVLRPVKDYELIIYAGLLIIIMLFVKDGLLGIAQGLWHKLTVKLNLNEKS